MLKCLMQVSVVVYDLEIGGTYYNAVTEDPGTTAPLLQAFYSTACSEVRMHFSLSLVASPLWACPHLKVVDGSVPCK